MEIYAIRNIETNRYYVGQTKKTYLDRYKRLKKWGNRTNNSELKKDIENFGYDCFEFIVLESNVSSVEELNNQEAFWAEKLNAYYPKGYNLIQCGNKKGFFSELTKRRMSEKKKGTVGWSKGKKFTKEHREKLSKAKEGHIPWNKGLKTGVAPWNKGLPMSADSKEKMRKKLIGKKAWNKGKSHSDSHRAALKKAWEKRKLVVA